MRLFCGANREGQDSAEPEDVAPSATEGEDEPDFAEQLARDREDGANFTNTCDADMRSIMVHYGPGADGSLWKSHGILGDPSLLWPSEKEKAARAAHPETGGRLPHESILLPNPGEEDPDA
jgi:hypothetical protein